VPSGRRPEEFSDVADGSAHKKRRNRAGSEANGFAGLPRQPGLRRRRASGLGRPPQVAYDPAPPIPPEPFAMPLLHLHDPHSPGSDGGAAAEVVQPKSLVGRGFVAWTRLCLRVPAVIVCVALVSAAVAGLWTARHLGYKVSRVDLLDPDSEYNKLWIDYIREFGEDDDAVIVVEGPSRGQVIAVLEELSREVARRDQLFRSVLHEVNLSQIRSKGLHYLSPAELAGIEAFLAGARPILEGGWSQLKVGTMVGGLSAQMVAGQPPATAAAVSEPPLVSLERYSEALLAAIEETSRAAAGVSADYVSPWPRMPESLSTLRDLSSEHLLAKEGRLGFVLLRLAKTSGGFAGASAATDELRRTIASVAARHPTATIGLTGLPIMEDDEMRTSQQSMIWASCVSLAAVAVVIAAGLGGLRHAFMANAVLGIGMAWAFGWATVSVGHLNILSVTFAVTMIGVGIDFGTYYVGRYLEKRRRGLDVAAALLETSGTVGPSILTGAVTTSVAFFCAALTSFVGVAELGMIAGGGILLCCAAELLVLPAVLALVDGGFLGRRIPEPVPVHAWLAPFVRHPRFVALAGVAGTLAVAGGLHELDYDHNLLNLQADGLESVVVEKQLLQDCDQSVWYALSIADSRDQLLERKEQLVALPTVERVDEIASLLPVDEEVKRPLITRIRDRLASLPERPPEIPIDRLDALGETLAWAHGEVTKRPGGLRTAWHLERTRDTLRRLTPEECYRAMAAFQQRTAGDLLTRLHALSAVADPEPPTLDDLPPSLVERFVGSSGRHLLKIYGRGDIWNFESLERFVKDVRSVDPRATGNPLQAYEASLEMKRSYEQAAVYALIVILGVLWLDFRSLVHAMLAALPLALGMLQALGLMGLLGIDLNPANLIGIPLIFGIAVDYGVHIVHDALERPGPYRMSPSTANSVLVGALTTILGFGALMIASHRGLESLGRVLTLGITCCTFTSLVILPAVLRMLHREETAVEQAEEEDEEVGEDEEAIRQAA
jgi:hopanoid biosynthesis associated RND transporter like protein HpnN